MFSCLFQFVSFHCLCRSSTQQYLSSLLVLFSFPEPIDCSWEKYTYFASLMLLGTFGEYRGKFVRGTSVNCEEALKKSTEICRLFWFWTLCSSLFKKTTLYKYVKKHEFRGQQLLINAFKP